MLRVLRIHVKADKFNDFRSAENEVLPAIKKSGLTTYSIARVRLGASGSDFIVVYGMDKWAEMGAKPAPRTGRGPAAARQFLPKTAALQEDTESNGTAICRT